MPLVFTSAVGLRATYGDAGAKLVEAKLQQVASLRPDISLQILSTGMGLVSATPDAVALYGDLKVYLNPQSASQNRSAGGVVIVGDQRVVPGFSVNNPVSDRAIDPDSTVLTDNPYGEYSWSNPAQCILPTLAVGRIAAGVDQPAAGLCSLLDTLVARPAYKTGYVEVTSRQWQNASSSVLSALVPSARVIVSPDGRVSAANASTFDCKYLYCNLHGFVSDSAWSGYDSGLLRPVPAVTPDAFLPQFVGGTVVFTEACYGLAINGKRNSNSNALSLLAAGAAAVIGSSGLAFGTASLKPQDLIDADVLARGFFNAALSARSTVGGSLLAARQMLRATSASSDVYVNKTLLEFQLLGDPSYALS